MDQKEFLQECFWNKAESDECKRLLESIFLVRLCGMKYSVDYDVVTYHQYIEKWIYMMVI
ncbi:3628_t:CDS:2 [Entrophospora sp. SA101]|nr:3628_t:CDS:2 [Entrophospora sp. SA101]